MLCECICFKQTFYYALRVYLFKTEILCVIFWTLKLSFIWDMELLFTQIQLIENVRNDFLDFLLSFQMILFCQPPPAACFCFSEFLNVASLPPDMSALVSYCFFCIVTIFDSEKFLILLNLKYSRWYCKSMTKKKHFWSNHIDFSGNVHYLIPLLADPN